MSQHYVSQLVRVGQRARGMRSSKEGTAFVSGLPAAHSPSTGDRNCLLIPLNKPFITPDLVLQMDGAELFSLLGIAGSA
jgi:hypothetical protein